MALNHSFHGETVLRLALAALPMARALSGARNSLRSASAKELESAGGTNVSRYSIIDQLRVAAYICCHHRLACGHGFEDHIRKTLAR